MAQQLPRMPGPIMPMGLLGLSPTAAGQTMQLRFACQDVMAWVADFQAQLRLWQLKTERQRIQLAFMAATFGATHALAQKNHQTTYWITIWQYQYLMRRLLQHKRRMAPMANESALENDRFALLASLKPVPKPAPKLVIENAMLSYESNRHVERMVRAHMKQGANPILVHAICELMFAVPALHAVQAPKPLFLMLDQKAQQAYVRGLASFCHQSEAMVNAHFAKHQQQYHPAQSLPLVLTMIDAILKQPALLRTAPQPRPVPGAQRSFLQQLQDQIGVSRSAQPVPMVGRWQQLRDAVSAHITSMPAMFPKHVPLPRTTGPVSLQQLQQPQVSPQPLPASMPASKIQQSPVALPSAPTPSPFKTPTLRPRGFG